MRVKDLEGGVGDDEDGSGGATRGSEEVGRAAVLTAAAMHEERRVKARTRGAQGWGVDREVWGKSWTTKRRKERGSSLLVTARRKNEYMQWVKRSWN